jgi:O-antigen/teichoic acid export membrane protein
MSRLKKFTQSILSSYLTLAANTLYTFATIPIALHYLSSAEFGLWGLTMEIGAYIALIDAGMGGSVSRMLIDHKDDPAGAEYGSVIKTGSLVGAVQALIILVFGSMLAFSISGLLHIPDELRSKFSWLLVGQTAFLALTFLTRIFQQILVAHQRYDISNYAQAVVFILSLAGMWAGFAMGFGVYSLLAAQAIGIVVVPLASVAAILRLHLFPAAGRWGKVNRRDFNELFAYGGSLFIFQIGTQFIAASQTILITRFLGLPAAGLWTAATRPFKMLTQLVWRTQEYSGPPLAEMFVRGELERMRDRLRDVTYITTNLAVLGAFTLALCNDTFVQIWTHGRMHWNPVNDSLLGIWFVVTTAMRAHVNLAGATKRFEFLCHVCLAEGIIFVGLNILLARVDGITRMLLLSIVCTSAFTLSYTLRRTRNFFGLAWQDLAAWHSSTWRIAWRLALIGFGTWMLTKDWQPASRLATNAMICGVAGGLVLLRYGFGKNLKNDIAAKLPPVLRRIMLSVRAA